MTALILSTAPDTATIAMDTLTTNNGQPVGFYNKFHYLPSIRTAFACTGTQGLVDAWVGFVNIRVAPAGIEALRDQSPVLLRECWQTLRRDCMIPSGLTATMYHVGFSEVTDEIVAHVFRSTRDFEAETLEYGTYWRPHDPEIEVGAGWTLAQQIHALMAAMQEQQRHIPSGERIHIGGEAVVLHLNREGASIFSAGRLEESRS